jgi:hypothetical protein
MTRVLYFAVAVYLLSGCSILGTSSKTSFSDDYYTLKKKGSRDKVYVDFEEEVITLYSVNGRKQSSFAIDSTIPGKMFPGQGAAGAVSDLKFGHNSFDLDLFTLPVKLRPAQNGVPAQLNANVNGAVYFGFRHDNFDLAYNPNPLGHSKRSITHFGISFGAFTGLGNTFMSPTNTNFYIDTEYDGIVWLKGIAAIAALNKFTAGLAVGTDNLLDRNKSHWLYEGKPWIGLTLGLNLN